MALPAKKYYKGAPANAVTTSNLGGLVGDTTFTVDTITGWPTSFPFYVVIEPGTSREEKLRVTAISTLTLTVVRQQDNTGLNSHASGSAIYPVFTALEASEANEVASIMTTKGDLITNDGSTINRLAVGATNTHVLQVDSTATNGIKWGQVATAGIADGAVTSAKILDGTIAKDDMSSTLLKLICPVGTITAYGGTSAPSGWLFCDGTSISGSYTELISLVGANTPNLKGRVPVGLNSSDSSFDSMFETGGAKTHTLSEAEMPSHTHTQNSHSHGWTGSYWMDRDSTGGYWTGSGEQMAIAGKGFATTSPTYSGKPLYFDMDSATATNQNAGSGSAHNNLQPYIVVNYIIKHDY